MKAYFLLLFCLLTMSACNAQDEAAEPKENIISVKNSTIQEVDKQTGQEISKHLTDLATSIPDVNDATAVVLGRYAL